jgi:lantibiotic modifying enzyme
MFEKCEAVAESLLPPRLTSGQEFRDEAERIGSLLCRIAEAEDRVQSAIPTDDVYKGTAGVALFLAYLSRAVCAPEIRRVAERLMTTPRAALRHGQLQPGGAYVGSGSVVWTLLHLWAVTRVEAYLTEALEAVGCLEGNAGGRAHDVIGGSAGLIRVLLELYRVTASRKALDMACLHGEQLVQSRIRMARGCGWVTVASTPITGFAHGSAGISCSLFHLAAATGNERYAEVALEGLEYERSTWCCVPGGSSRPHDRLVPTGNVDTSSSWCRGASGIAMSRFTLPERFLGANEKWEIEMALKEFVMGGRISDSLCHGLFGDVDLLISAGNTLGRADLKDLALNRAANALQRRNISGRWCTPAPQSDPEALGLMYGLAGVGYGLLRVADPDATPSLLAFDAIT